ncbi:MAG: cell division protein ZipA C-terminal FtsZ-binding domain-containing protein [Methylotenera sp.]
MSNLYISLIVIGVSIIAAVLAYNWWQEQQFNQQVDKNFLPLQKDALLDDPSIDVDQLKHGFEDTIVEDFTAKNKKNTSANQTTEPYITHQGTGPSPDNMLPDDVSINEAYSQLTSALKSSNPGKLNPSKLNPHYLSSGKTEPDNSNQNPLSNTSEKPAQHGDIKAIFDVAFGQTSRVAGASQSTKVPDVSKSEQQDSGNLSTSTSAQENVEKPVGLPAMLQAQMDLTAILHLATEAPTSKLVKSLVGLFDGYDKPVFVHTLSAHGLASNQTENPVWTLLKESPANQLVSKIACSMQLADRAGAVSRNLLNRFQLAVETLGKDLNAHVEWQSTGDALTTATALDTFCIEVDKTIGFHLVHGDSGAFTGTKLKGLAEAQGFTLSSDGSFKFLNEDGKVSFVMFNRDNFPFNREMLRNSVVKGITFQLDIPHVQHCAEAFNKMVDVAKQMEIALHATLVDDNNKVLGDIQVEKIRQQLKVIHATMLVRGIIPGSDNAIRLFS